MNAQPESTQRQNDTADAPQRREESERLDAIAQRVAADARRDPQAYARESRVPAGGE